MGGWGCGYEMNCVFFPSTGTTRRDQMQTRSYVLSMATEFQYFFSSLWKVKNMKDCASLSHISSLGALAGQNILIWIHKLINWNEPKELAVFLHYIYRWTYAGNTTSSCFLNTQVVQREKRDHWQLVLLQYICSLKSSLLQNRKCGGKVQNTPTSQRQVTSTSHLCPTMISAGECLHVLWLHSVRNWHCDQWSGLPEKCWEPLLLFKCLWVFYTPLGSTGWKESTLHHVMYASKLREIRYIIPQNL